MSQHPDRARTDRARTDRARPTLTSRIGLSIPTAVGALLFASVVAFGSGMAALDTLLKLLASGDHVVCAANMYGGSYRLMERVYRDFGVEFTYVAGGAMLAALIFRCRTRRQVGRGLG